MTQSLKWVSYATLLFLAALLAGCPDVPDEDKRCINGISYTTINPNGRICSDDCDCNNQQYIGKCLDKKCASSARETCFQAGQKRLCSLPEDPAKKGCIWGVQTCQGEGLYSLYWDDCKLPQAADSEKDKVLCTDGIDNNCNLKTDYLADPGCAGFCRAGDTRPCYDLEDKEPFPSFGVCRRGQQICQTDNTWGACLGAIKPSKEICDKQDNDCDGKVDEDADGCKPQPDCQKGQTRPCYTAPRGCSQVGDDVQCTGICKAGVRTCDDKGNWGECKGQEVAAAFEDCNGLDDNCNGTVDEGCICPKEGDVQSCFTGAASGRGKGQCKDGIQICQRGSWSDCKGAALPRQEACNGLDDNCDGQVDEGCSCDPGDTQACFLGPSITRGKGECKEGTQTCVRGVWGPCEGSGLPIQEQCDGKDNDCDGKVDEIEDLRSPRCKKQDGVCFGSVQRCAGAAGWQPCNDADYKKYNPEYVANGLEDKSHCDGLDNDCDGKADEGCQASACKSGSVRGCYTASSATQQKGTCRDGIEACIQGAWSGQCLGQVVPRTEICGNKLDDDCDGTVDNGCSEPTQETTPEPTSEPDVNPDAGPDASEPVPEGCQNGATRPCVMPPANPNAPPPKGVCRDGIETCSNGAWGACTQKDPFTTHEICDGKDNNCNGLIDEVTAAAPLEGLKPPPPKCLKQSDICSGATLRCGPANYGTKWTQAVTDAGSGKEVCSLGDYLRATADYEDSDETKCDGLDNDCDGKTDENCPWYIYPKTRGTTEPSALLQDNADNLYVMGRMVGGSQFSLFNYAAAHNKYQSNRDAFIAKFDKNGQPLWVKPLIGKNSNHDVAVHNAALGTNQQSLYLVGHYTGELIIENQTLRASDYGGQNAGGTARDIFVAKFKASDGKLQWATNFGGTSNDTSAAIAVASTGMIVVAFQHSFPILLPTSHTRMIVPQVTTFDSRIPPNRNPSVRPGQIGVLALKEATTTSGAIMPRLEWTLRANSDSHLYPKKMAFDSTGKLWLIGEYTDNPNFGLYYYPRFKTMSFGAHHVTPTPVTQRGDWRYGFIATIDMTKEEWSAVAALNATQQNRLNDIKIHSSGIFLAGSFTDSQTFPTASGSIALQSWQSTTSNFSKEDALILKLDTITTTQGSNGPVSSLAWSWATHMGSVAGDAAIALDIDSSGNIFVAGRMQDAGGTKGGIINFGPRPSASMQALAYSQENGFAAKLTPTGQPAWGIVFGTDGTGYYGNLLATGKTSTAIYVGGQLRTQSYLGSRLTPNNGTNFFLWQLQPCPSSSGPQVDCYTP